MANNPNPPSFRTDVHRNPTKKWAVAPTYSYAGDEWGGYDDYDEYGSYDDPPPLPKPTGLRQPGQTLSQVDTGVPSDSVRASSGYTKPAAGTLQRSDSFEYGDDRRAFSAGTNLAPEANLSSTYGGDMSSNTPTGDSQPAKYFPPRKSSLSQAQPPPSIAARSADYATAAPTNIPDEVLPPASETSAATTSPRLVRPADIYKRMEEERNKQRQSSDSARPSMDSLPPSGPTNTERPQGYAVGNVAGTTSLSTPLQTVPERKSEYGLDGFTVDNPALAQAIGAKSTSPDEPSSSLPPGAKPSSLDEPNFSLPQVNRISGFGSDFWSSSTADDTAASETSAPTLAQPQLDLNTEPTKAAQVVSEAASAPDPAPSSLPADTALRNQPSLGLRSAVGQAFEPDEPSSARSESNYSGFDSDMSRYNSTTGVSPIMSRMPSAGTATRRAEEYSQTVGNYPAISEEPSSSDERPTSSSTLKGEVASGAEPASTESSTFATRGTSGVLSSTTEGASPARKLEISPEIQVPEAAHGEIGLASPTSSGYSSFTQDAPTQSLDGSLINEQGRTDEQELASQPAIANSALASSGQTVSPGVSAIGQDVSRTASPSKGRVRDLADKYTEIHNSRVNSPSPVSSISSKKRRGESSSSIEESESEESRPASADSDVYDQSNQSNQTAWEVPLPRPQLPGSWISYANSERSLTPNPRDVEDEPVSATTPRATSARSGASTPRAEAVPDFTPANRSKSSTAEDPLAALQAAGSAIGASLLSSVGMAGDASGGGSEQYTPSEDEQTPHEAPRDRTTGNLAPPRIFATQGVISPMSSIGPTPLTIDVSPNEGGEYFPAPLKQRGLSPQPSPITSQDTEVESIAPAQRSESYMSTGAFLRDTEVSPEDTENDRLRKDIVRSLNSPGGETSSTPAAATLGSDFEPTSITPDESRPTSVLPREYDSYWAATRAENSTPPVPFMPPVRDAKAEEPVAATSSILRPDFGRHRFSWEEANDDDEPHAETTAQAPIQSEASSRGLSNTEPSLGEDFKAPSSFPTAALFEHSNMEQTQTGEIPAQRSAPVDEDAGKDFSTSSSSPLTVITSPPSDETDSVADAMSAADRRAAAMRGTSRGAQKGSSFSPITEVEEQSPSQLTVSPPSHGMSPSSHIGSPISGLYAPDTFSALSPTFSTDTSNDPGHVQEASAVQYEAPPAHAIEVHNISLADNTTEGTESGDRDDTTQGTPASKLIPLKDILGMKQHGDRLATYNASRNGFAQMDTGLGGWLTYMVATHPDHLQALPAGQRPALDTSLAASMRSKFAPGSSKVRGSPGATNQPYYQQYLDSAGSIPSTSSLPSSSSPAGPGSPSQSRNVSGQSKGKDFLHTASILGGKAGTSAKGLFAKGKNRLRGPEKDNSTSNPRNSRLFSAPDQGSTRNPDLDPGAPQYGAALPQSVKTPEQSEEATQPFGNSSETRDGDDSVVADALGPLASRGTGQESTSSNAAITRDLASPASTGGHASQFADSNTTVQGDRQPSSTVAASDEAEVYRTRYRSQSQGGKTSGSRDYQGATRPSIDTGDDSQRNVHPLFRTPEHSPQLLQSPSIEEAMRRLSTLDNKEISVSASDLKNDDGRPEQTLDDRLDVVSPIVSPSPPRNLDELPPSVRKRYRATTQSNSQGQSDNAFDAGSTPQPDRSVSLDQASAPVKAIFAPVTPVKPPQQDETDESTPPTQGILNHRQSIDPRSNGTEYQIANLDPPPVPEPSPRKQRSISPWQKFRTRSRGASRGEKDPAQSDMVGEGVPQQSSAIEQPDESSRTQTQNAWQRLRSRSRGASHGANDPSTEPGPGPIRQEPEAEPNTPASATRGRSPWQRFRARSRGASMDQGQAPQPPSEQPPLPVSSTETPPVTARRPRTSISPWKRRSWFRSRDGDQDSALPTTGRETGSPEIMRDSDMAEKLPRREHGGYESASGDVMSGALGTSVSSAAERRTVSQGSASYFPTPYSGSMATRPSAPTTSSDGVGPSGLSESDRTGIVRNRQGDAPRARSSASPQSYTPNSQGSPSDAFNRSSADQLSGMGPRVQDPDQGPRDWESPLNQGTRRPSVPGNAFSPEDSRSFEDSVMTRPGRQSTDRRMDPYGMVEPLPRPSTSNRADETVTGRSPGFDEPVANPARRQSANRQMDPTTPNSSDATRKSTSGPRPSTEKRPSQDRRSSAQKRTSWFGSMFSRSDGEPTRRLTKPAKRKSVTNSGKESPVKDRDAHDASDDWAASALGSINNVGRPDDVALQGRNSPIRDLPPVPPMKDRGPTPPGQWTPPVPDREAHVSYLQDADIFPVRPSSLEGRHSVDTERYTSPPPENTYEPDSPEAELPPVPRLPEDIETPNSIRNSRQLSSSQMLNLAEVSAASNGSSASASQQQLTQSPIAERGAETRHRSTSGGLSFAQRISSGSSGAPAASAVAEPHRDLQLASTRDAFAQSRQSPRPFSTSSSAPYKTPQAPYKHQSRSSGDGPPSRYVPWLSTLQNASSSPSMSTPAQDPTAAQAPTSAQVPYIPATSDAILAGPYNPATSPVYTSREPYVPPPSTRQPLHFGSADTDKDLPALPPPISPMQAVPRPPSPRLQSASRSAPATEPWSRTGAYAYRQSVSSDDDAIGTAIGDGPSDTTAGQREMQSMLPAGMGGEAHNEGASRPGTGETDDTDYTDAVSEVDEGGGATPLGYTKFASPARGWRA